MSLYRLFVYLYLHVLMACNEFKSWIYKCVIDISKNNLKIKRLYRTMKGLCDNCLTSNVDVIPVKGKSLCSDCANKDSNN